MVNFKYSSSLIASMNFGKDLSKNYQENTTFLLHFSDKTQLFLRSPLLYLSLGGYWSKYLVILQ